MNSQLDLAELAATRRETALELDAIEWDSEPEPTARAPHTEQPPTTPMLFKPELLNQDPNEWVKQYVDSLLTDPNWHAEQEKKRAEKQARRQAREERLAARKKKRTVCKRRDELSK